MIPDCIDIGAPWKVLPPGVHTATLKEIEKRFSTNDRRRFLFEGLTWGVKALKKAGCIQLFLDGSFVTAKTFPNDYDICWDDTGISRLQLDPVFLDFNHNRKKQKEKYYGEYFPTTFLANGARFFLDYFQTDKHTGKAKGIIRLQLSKEPI